jgi:hypothetical protein
LQQQKTNKKPYPDKPDSATSWQRIIWIQHLYLWRMRWWCKINEQRFYCCSTFHSHILVLNNEHNSYSRKNVKWSPEIKYWLKGSIMYCDTRLSSRNNKILRKLRQNHSCCWFLLVLIWSGSKYWYSRVIQSYSHSYSCLHLYVQNKL